MDIHRSRFVPFPSSAINALAFSHVDTTDDVKDPDCLRLALGRANGNIEIWNPANGAWLQERVFHGGKDRSVEGLAWTQEPDERDDHGKIIPGRLRLFSIGYSSSVTEWNLATGLPLRHSSGNHSEVWCFAAQPQAKASTKGLFAQDEDASQKLIAGCADGTLVLLSTAEDDLRFEKFVTRATAKKARALSVTFKDRKIALAGFADSMIRVYDTRNGYVIRNISLGSAGPGGPKETLVWNIKCLPNGDFVSGDSNGDIRIYDGKNYSHIQRISGHEADVLDLTVSRDGTMIFSGGMDCRTCFYTLNKKTAPGVASQKGKWRKVSHQRYHDHDVKAMATYDGAKLSVLASGGIDTQPIVVPIRHFGKELSRGLPALPHTPPLASAPDARLMASWWNCELRVWRVKSLDNSTEKPKAVARLALQGDENITSATMARDGGLLAVATIREVKLFQLIETKPEAGSGLRIRKLEMPLSVGAQIVRFTPDGKWLAIVTATDDILTARIVRSDNPLDRPRVLHKLLPLPRLPRDRLPRDSLNGSAGQYGRSVTHAEFSTDGTVFAVADLAGYIDTWVTEGHEDLTAPEVDIDEPAASPADDDESDDEENSREQITFFGQRWVRNPSAHLLPRLDSAPVLLSFQPTPEGASRPEPNGNPAVHPTRRNPHPHSHDIPDTEHRLLIVSAHRQLYMFDVLAGRLSEWSRRNPPSSYPSQYQKLKSSAKGCIWDVSEQERIWLYGEDWLFMFDLSRDLPILEPADTSDLASGGDKVETKMSKKRKREVAKENARKGISGAGDVVPENDAPVRKLRKYNSGRDGSPKSTQVALHEARMTTESDNESDDEQDALTDLRRQDSAVNGMTNGNGPTQPIDLVKREGTEDAVEPQKASPEHWWHSFKYRPILGIVPIGGGGGEPPEVVLVERPSWDLDLPPRFMGAHEG